MASAGLAVVLLMVNASARAEAAGPSRLFAGWRGWDDLAIAAGFFEQHDFPVAPYAIRNAFRRKDDDFLRFRDTTLAGIADGGIRPSQFWRGVSLAPPPEWRLARRFDDAGRALALGLAFRGVGGVTPFLLAWMAVLALLPLFPWIAWEFEQAGMRLAGAVFLFGLCCSAFVVDTLELGYSAAGFQLLALLSLVPLTVYALVAEPTPRGLMARGLVTALVLAAAAQARNATVLIYPAFLTAMVVGALRGSRAARAHTSRGRRVAALVLAGAGLLGAAHFVADAAVEAVIARTLERRQQWRRPPSGHDLWITIWQGLGDFDRTKGHAFLDKAGEEVALREGARTRLSARGERIFRDLVLEEIREDPGWFAGILVRRLWATLSLRKLWPWGPWHGQSFLPATHPSEGVTDNYYQLTAQADWMVIGRRSYELPLPILLAPIVALAAIALVPQPAPGATVRRRARRGLAVAGVVGLGAIATPVLITTASAVECQMIVVSHLLGMAFLADVIRALPLRRRSH